MMSYKQWKMIQESFSGNFTLGVKSPKSLGITGSKLTEMGFPPKGEEDDMGGEMDMMGDEGGDELPTLDMGMGADTGHELVDLSGPKPAPAPPQGGSGCMVDIHALKDLLIALGLGKEMDLKDDMMDDEDDAPPALPAPTAKKSPFPPAADDAGDDMDDEMDDMDDSEDDDSGNPFAAASDEEGEEESDDDSGNPFAAASDEEDSDGDGEEDAEDADDDDDGEPDATDMDDEEEEEKPVDKKFMKSGKKKKCGSGMKYMCGKCSTDMEENADFFATLVKQGRGNVNKKFSNGLPMKEDVLFPEPEQNQKKTKQEPGPGEVGYAPVTRFGF